MRLYKTVGAHDNAMVEKVVRWSGTQAEAATARKDLNSYQKIPRANITTEEVEIPTDKKGLLEWLNTNVR